MRKVYYTERTIKRLDDFGATPEQLKAIASKADELAKKPDLGYKVSFVMGELLFRYDLDDFALIYVFDQKELNIVNVYKRRLSD